MSGQFHSLAMFLVESFSLREQFCQWSVIREGWFQWSMAHCKTKSNHIFQTQVVHLEIYILLTIQRPDQNHKKTINYVASQPTQWSTLRWVPPLWCLKLSRVLKDIVSRFKNIVSTFRNIVSTYERYSFNIWKT